MKVTHITVSRTMGTKEPIKDKFGQYIQYTNCEKTAHAEASAELDPMEDSPEECYLALFDLVTKACRHQMRSGRPRTAENSEG